MSETQTAVNAIEMRGIVMEFSGVRALDGVDFPCGMILRHL